MIYIIIKYILLLYYIFNFSKISFLRKIVSTVRHFLSSVKLLKKFALLFMAEFHIRQSKKVEASLVKVEHFLAFYQGCANLPPRSIIRHLIIVRFVSNDDDNFKLFFELFFFILNRENFSKIIIGIIKL